MSDQVKFLMAIIATVGIAIGIRIWLFAPDLKLYHNCRWFTKLRILLFSIKCDYCGQIAVRRQSPGDIKHCLSDECCYKATIESGAGWRNSGSNGPIDGSLGWKLNKKAKK